jgi:hypothetical protein
MKAKSEIRKKSAARARKQMPQGKGATETFWLQSSDFFRTLDFRFQDSIESPSLKQFNSDF